MINLTLIKSLNLTKTKVTANSLTRLTNITDLDLSGSSGVTNDLLTKLINIKVLDIQMNQQITYDAIPMLTNLIELAYGGIGSMKTLKGMSEIQEAFPSIGFQEEPSMSMDVIGDVPGDGDF